MTGRMGPILDPPNLYQLVTRRGLDTLLCPVKVIKDK